jgi:hypothetical protein
LLLFHDTHHRVVSALASMAAMHLEGFDGVLAFGEVGRDAYIRWAAYDALLLGSQLNPLDEGWAGVGPANTPPVTAFRNYRGEELGIHLL